MVGIERALAAAGRLDCMSCPIRIKFFRASSRRWSSAPSRTSRPSHRYLALMALTWALAALVVAGFTLLVDPIGISPLRVAIAGFNASRPFRQDYDWIVKRYDVLRIHPTTIFMGSLRVKQSIDPGLLASMGFAPAYNGGINGSAAYEEIKSYLQYYSSVDKNLHYVFIEAFAAVMLSYDRTQPGVRIPMPESGCASHAPNAAGRRPLRTCGRYRRLCVGVLLDERRDLCGSHRLRQPRPAGLPARKRLCAGRARAASFQRPQRAQFCDLYRTPAARRAGAARHNPYREADDHHL
jgi:hypothetical protein